MFQIPNLIDNGIVRLSDYTELIDREMVIVCIAKMDSCIAADMDVRTCFRAGLQDTTLRFMRRW
jgi:hypothetical protein